MIQIDDKYSLLLGKTIYNKSLDKYGYISSIEINHLIGGPAIWLSAYYDTFDNSHMTFFEEFIKGEVQFTIIHVDGVPCEIKEKNESEIKEALGSDFRQDMIIYINEQDKKEKDKENENRQTQKLHTDLISLTNISLEIFKDNFYCIKLYQKYKQQILDEKQFLYAVINYLSKELKREKNRTFNYFVKYELDDLFKKECDCDV